jgi:hypothetical protein
VQINPVLIDYIKMLQETYFRNLQKIGAKAMEEAKRQCEAGEWQCRTKELAQNDIQFY